MKEFDVVVVGAGPGGYVAAIRAGQLGMRTAIVEKENLGGTCLNWGCIPTKALLRNAEIISLLKEGKTFGFSFDEKSLTVDYAAAHKRSREVAGKLSKGVEFLMKKNKVEVFKGTGRLTSRNTVDVLPQAGGFGGVSVGEVSRGGKDGTGEVVGVQAVGRNNFGQQGVRGCQDGLTGVLVGGDGPAHATTDEGG